MVSVTVIIMRSMLVLGLLLVLDYYVFSGIKTAIGCLKSERWRSVFKWLYWGTSIGFILTVAVSMLLFIDPKAGPSNPWFQYLFATLVLLYVPKIFFAVILFGEDLYRLGLAGYRIVSSWLTPTMITEPQTFVSQPNQTPEPLISRNEFISQAAAVTATVPFVGILHGVTKGKYSYTLHEHTLFFPHLPQAFDGYRLVQLSDIHTGSFDNPSSVMKGVELVNAQNPDVILITGDVVNNVASELDPWLQTFNKLTAKDGVYSVLGNHDYGDYVWKKGTPAWQANLDALKGKEAEMGWKLLLDQNTYLRRGQDKIALVGVENWGKGFQQYGNLDKALEGLNPEEFKILLSHDPSHWDEVVQPHPHRVDLTLSGHTHGMQFGVEIGPFKWSPVSMRYQHWAGLYTQDQECLNVNRGFGFIGFPGRVGIFPEVTVITLKRGQSNDLA